MLPSDNPAQVGLHIGQLLDGFYLVSLLQAAACAFPTLLICLLSNFVSFVSIDDSCTGQFDFGARKAKYI